MEIKRTMMVETEQFEVGDVVSFTLTDVRVHCRGGGELNLVHYLRFA